MPAAEPSPYDVLGITPAATPPEVHAAYERALAAATGAPDREACTTAYLHLRNTGRRLGADILEYAAPDPSTTAREAFAGVAEQRFLPRDAPPPPITTLVVLRRSTTAEDHREPPPTDTTFATPARFTATADVLPPVDIPR
ncbi:hypothetical protein B4N89_04740 [Embleya scabrispora]|uniref:Uncharacterized protein n=1 Tax=Embleya scabrispora TaxID=159449 RepID=A0A1T3NUD2_9ACTN|nr:hypothetical protein [Embleya scabrispora]OPC80345.1 hypothetical protein B4N89_04740 [Embleya scabrispora]